MRRIVSVVLIASWIPLTFAQEKPFGAVANVTAIEIMAEVLDAQGRVPGDLKASDFVILEDGVERAVSSIETVCAQTGSAAIDGATPPTATAPATNTSPGTPASAWDVLIYIDYELSSRTTVRDAVRTLITESGRMTRAGRVEVVVADPTPRRLLAPSRDPEAVQKALTTANGMTAKSRLANVRRAFIDTSSDKSNSSEPSYAGMTDMRSSIAEETTLVRNFLGRLSSWLGGYPKRGSRALLLVADGFDVNPSDFYSETMTPAVSPERHGAHRQAGGAMLPKDVKAQLQANSARREAGKLTGDEMREDGRLSHPIAQQAAAAGWTIISLRGGLNTEMAADSSMDSGDKAVSNFLTGGGGTGRPTGTLQSRPVEALAGFAEATGGALVADTSKFGTAIDTLCNRVRLTYQVSRPADGLVRQIEVVSRRPGLTVKAARFASSSTPELVASSRVSSLIEGSGAPGELPVTARLELQKTKDRNTSATLEARAGLAPLEPLRAQLKSAAMRVSIGVAIGKEQPRIIHQVHPYFDLSKLSSATFTSPMQLPPDVEKVAIVVEELSSGAWGGTVLPVAKNQNVITTAGWTDATGDAMPWLAWEDALREAQKVGKLIVQCAGCDERIFADSTLRNTLNAFVVTQKTDSSPRVLLLDPWGRERFEWKPANAPELVAKLRSAMSIGSALVQAGAQGDTAESHLALGFAYLKTQSFAEAQKAYAAAEAAARAKGDVVLAERAQIQGAAARAQAGASKEAIATLERIVKAPQSTATEAEAWLILGHLRRAAGNERGAHEAYARAADRAPAGSELKKVATKLMGGG